MRLSLDEPAVNTWRILQGDVLEQLKTLPDESVHCCVTSPPYWGLRDYGVPGQLGLEKTPEEYIARMVGIFSEVKRVLRDDGTLWLNMGDSYNAYNGNRGTESQYAGKRNAMEPHFPSGHGLMAKGLKPKDLVGIPWMLAFALRADGWYLRSDIIWSKPNPMPESVSDRPTKSHEYLFLLAKSADYFFDQEAVKEPSVDKESFGGMRKRPQYIKGYPKEMGENNFHKLEGKTYPTRNIRSVWNISTHPFSGAHFATFPEKLVEPCIKAGTSEKGVCGKCGRPWVRQVERIGQTTTEKARERGYSEKRGDGGKLVTNNLDYAGGHGNNVRPSKTVGWKPSCSCNADPVPATALDPFSGSGTVGVVALKHGRNFIGIELNEKYVAMARRRVGEVSPMFSKEDA